MKGNGVSIFPNWQYFRNLADKAPLDLCMPSISVLLLVSFDRTEKTIMQNQETLSFYTIIPCYQVSKTIDTLKHQSMKFFIFT